MDRLVEAMETRGFLICRKYDCIYFSKGNTRDELILVERMFKEIGCETTIENREIRIHAPLREDQLQGIIWYPARNHEIQSDYKSISWKYFAKRRHGGKVNTFVLETGVARLVKSLSAAGVSTFDSCDGHGKRSPYITFSGYAQGIWFDLLLSEIKEVIELKYDWKMKWDFPMGPTLIAKEVKEQGWELKDILDDTTNMAKFFYENAEEISKTKRDIFGPRFKTTRKIVKTMNKNELYEWMSLKYKEYKRNKLKT